MWLIDTSSLELKLVTDADDHPYAILSHTWGEDEVSFEDMANLVGARAKAGFGKIYRTCELARSRRIQYAWVDTCCIDKRSSAELTEAINSMFQWYKKATICFVYLSDFVGWTTKIYLRDHLSTCRWFTRGWTLQELIASQVIEFYNQQWKKLGDKRSLQSHLSTLTGVDPEILEDCSKLNTIPVARRMYWAANRTTTRTEDIAYCLFGIFDVNLPLIYGEGRKAFIRLQEAIARETTDLSLFAWESSTSHGAFAHSPSDFQSHPNIYSNENLAIPSKEFTLTNKGLRFETILYQGNGEYRMKLHCRTSTEVETSLALRLAQTAHGYVRLGLAEVSSMDESWLRHDHETSVYIPKAMNSIEFEQFHHFRFKVTTVIDDRFTCLFTPAPSHLWDTSINNFITSGQPNFIGMIHADIQTNFHISPVEASIQKQYPTTKIILLLRPGFRPWAGIFNTSHEKTEFHPFDMIGNRSPSDQDFWDALRVALNPLLEKGEFAPTTLILRPTNTNASESIGVLDIRVILDVKLRLSNPITPYELVVRVQKA